MTVPTGYRRAAAVILAACAVLATSSPQVTEHVVIRGQDQTLHLYGDRHGAPVIVSSGDGGWVHLAPHVADMLARNGCFVIGFDVKAYLEAFTTSTATLRPEEAALDYRALIDLARQQTGRSPVLVGVSEGAGLSVLAAADADNHASIDGLVGVGLGDRMELGWRWRDAVIYVTHAVPHEPTFSVKATIDRVGVPVAMIQSSRDEFVPQTEVDDILNRAHEPKRLWRVTASDHRFSDNLPDFDRDLLEALAWIRERTPAR